MAMCKLGMEFPPRTGPVTARIWVTHGSEQADQATSQLPTTLLIPPGCGRKPRVS
jgi:hypothetical protein